jgi:hypothetical protein
MDDRHVPSFMLPSFEGKGATGGANSYKEDKNESRGKSGGEEGTQGVSPIGKQNHSGKSEDSVNHSRERKNEGVKFSKDHKVRFPQQSFLILTASST